MVHTILKGINMFDSSDITTGRTLKNIKKVLKYSLKEKYDIENEEVLQDLLNIHGITTQRFDFVKTIETAIAEKLNDFSIDANSNKNEKTIEAVTQEAIAPVKKAIGYDLLYRQMREIYGKEEAKRLTGELYDLSMGLSDSTNILKPYCWAFNASFIVTEGRRFGQLYSKEATRVSSYISALCETIHQLSSHLAGAIAIGSFFLDIAHLSLYGKDPVDLRELKTNKQYRKKLENEFQQFTHSVNHLSRSGAESPFTNLSIFDRVKIRFLIEDMSWYFPFEDLPIFHPKDMNDEDKNAFYTEYLVDCIMEVQNIFLDFFDKGDPLKNGAPYRFPVITLNLSKKTRGDREIIEDHRFLRSVCRRDIFRYNIFVSGGTKVASCCRLISDSEMLEYAAQANSFGAGGSISLGSHRVCTINFMRIALESQNQSDFFNILWERVASAAKVLKAHKTLIKALTDQGLQMFISMGWINMNRLFSTFGMLGLYEASIIMEKKFGAYDGGDFIKDVLELFNEAVDKESKEHGIIGNIEQIPAESFAIRLALADKFIYGEDCVPFKMYTNQFIPLWEDATIWEKMDVDGKYNKLITGGGIVHVQIGEKVTSKQAEKIIRYSVNSGCEHFALNSVWSECGKGHTIFGRHKVCTECGEPIVEYYTRVVGFFTPVSSWQDVRREWEFPNRTFSKLPDNN